MPDPKLYLDFLLWDLPEVSTVIIIDADKQGLFRNTKSLVQTIGRASRNENSHSFRN